MSRAPFEILKGPEISDDTLPAEARGCHQRAWSILSKLSFLISFPAPIQPCPLAGILSDEILYHSCNLETKKFCVFLFIECSFYLDRTGRSIRSAGSLFSPTEHGQDGNPCLRERWLVQVACKPIDEEWTGIPPRICCWSAIQIKDSFDGVSLKISWPRW